jgi:hypothetical protein
MQELKTLQEKQLTWSTSVDKNLDEILTDIESCKNSSMAPLKKTFKDKLESIGNENKEFYSNLTKFGKILDKEFLNNLESTYKEWDFDPNIILEVLMEYFYQTGQVHVGSTFEKESKQFMPNKLIFTELTKLLGDLYQYHMDTLLLWSETNNCGDLTYQLHQFVYSELLVQKNVTKCVSYAKQHLQSKPDRLKYLLGAIVYVNKLNSSPYASLFSENRVLEIQKQLIHNFCRVHDIPVKSHLYSLLSCGNAALPSVVKFVHKNIEILNSRSNQMPFEISLEPEFVFQSIFTCPLSKEVSLNPMMLPCGHVLSLNSLEKLRGTKSSFKCPYCPMDCQRTNCEMIKF